MKKVLFTIALACTALFAVADNNDGLMEAQTKKGPYLTNGFWDNWFVSVAGGAQIYFGAGDGDRADFGDRLTPEIAISVGKWITPSVGVRAQASGYKLKSYTPTGGAYGHKFTSLAAHADFLWNVSNAIGGYRTDRFYEVVPYVGAGMARSGGVKEKYRDNHKYSMTLNIGVINKFRISNAFDIEVELKAWTVNNDYDKRFAGHGKQFRPVASLTAGLTYNFNKNNFNRPTVAVPADYTPYNNRIAGLESDLSASKAKADQLAKDLAAEKARAEALANEAKKSGKFDYESVVFFDINKATLSPKTKASIEMAAKMIKSTPDKKYQVVGYADKQTGSAAYNTKLAQKRAVAVYDALVAAGVNKDQIEAVNGFSEGAQPFGKPIYMNRAVIIK